MRNGFLERLVTFLASVVRGDADVMVIESEEISMASEMGTFARVRLPLYQMVDSDSHRLLN